MKTMVSGFKKMTERDIDFNMHLAVCSDSDPLILDLEGLPVWDKERSVSILSEIGKSLADKYKGEIVSGFILTFQATAKGPFKKDVTEEEMAAAESMEILVSVGKSVGGRAFLSTSSYNVTDGKVYWIDDQTSEEANFDEFGRSISGIHFEAMDALWSAFKFTNIIKRVYE